jgi:hypothetical protein
MYEDVKERIVLQAEGFFNSIVDFFSSKSDGSSCSSSFFSVSSVGTVGAGCCSLGTGVSLGFSSSGAFSDSGELSLEVFSLMIVCLTTGP